MAEPGWSLRLFPAPMLLDRRASAHPPGGATLKGYSVSDGSIVFRRNLASDMIRLMHVDERGNVYLGDFENQVLVREPL